MFSNKRIKDLKRKNPRLWSNLINNSVTKRNILFVGSLGKQFKWSEIMFWRNKKFNDAGWEKKIRDFNVEDVGNLFRFLKFRGATIAVST